MKIEVKEYCLLISPEDSWAGKNEKGILEKVFFEFVLKLKEDGDKCVALYDGESLKIFSGIDQG